MIGVVHLQGDGQLAFEAVGDLLDLGLILAFDHQRGGAEHFFLQRRIGEEVAGGGDVKPGLALVGRFADLAAGDLADLVVAREPRGALLVGVIDARGEHGLRGALLERLAGGLDESVEVGALLGDHQPGLVQNCPAPMLSEATKPLAISSPRALSAAGSGNTGLIELISA